MGTDNRRVAAYLPVLVDQKFIEFKLERGLASQDKPNANDSKALIAILQEYFGVSQEVAYPVAHKVDLSENEQFQELRERFDLLEWELASKLERLESRMVSINAHPKESVLLSTGELAKRLGMNSTTLSHWKSSNPKRGKSSDELLKATRAKDPDDIGWQVDKVTQKFYPDRDLPSNSSGVLQGSLLNSESKGQVNPLPVGSKRSGEG